MPRWMSRRLGLLLCLVGFVWGVTLINMTLISYNTDSKSSGELKEEILQLSEKYVHQLASETRETIDGPYAGRLTGYDLKKTLAVLLENMMYRMDRLEQRVDETLRNSSLPRGPLPEDNHGLVLPPAPVPPDHQQRGLPEVNAPANEPKTNAAGEPQPDALAGNSPDKRPINAQSLLLGAQEDCAIKPVDIPSFPHCKGKMSWMSSHWKSDPCYAQFGVDGHDCSFRVYLSEVENWCPLLPGRTKILFNKTKHVYNKAELNLDLDSLINTMRDPGQRQNYMWMRQRITRMWPEWVNAAKRLAGQQHLSDRKQHKILVHLGLLSQKSGFKIAENSFRGGPLGELVQWSDIISTLHLLGHDLLVTSEVEQLSALFVKAGTDRKSCRFIDYFKALDIDLIYTDIVGRRALRRAVGPHFDKMSYLRVPRPSVIQHSRCPAHGSMANITLIYSDPMGRRQIQRLLQQTSLSRYRILAKFPSAESQCQSREKLPIDMIFTDIVGLTQFKRKVKNGYGKFSCILRIIDSFGTEPGFNYAPFAKEHRMKTTWGMQNLNPQQFFTMFPHSPDNSFIGFVVEQHINRTSVERAVRKNQAVVYGKAEYMWAGRESYLEVIRKHVEIHGTVYIDNKSKSTIPQFIHNHGILSGADLQKLLSESKLFIGLGFPYEGPAPLEALAQGCVFLNPKFTPPHNSVNTKFFKGKPTLRKLTSQHPYTEDFIGAPHVHTIPIDNHEEVERVLLQALSDVDSGKVQPFIMLLVPGSADMPYEFTQEGMLQRVNAYLKGQDFCDPEHPAWPPEEDITIVMSDAGQSCKDACWKQELICEPSYFSRINNNKVMERHMRQQCQSVVAKEDLYYPGYSADSNTCFLQSQPMLFSCVGELADLQRFCPCRSFIQGQTAICRKCV